MARKRNKLFIWQGVLTDYTSGMIVALAPDVETAIKHAAASGALGSVLDDMRTVTPDVYEVTAGNVVTDYVYGGG